MSLEALLKPFKAVDEALLKQCTRFSMWMEEKYVPKKIQPLLVSISYSALSMVLAHSFSGSRIDINDAGPLETIIGIPVIISSNMLRLPLGIHDWIYSYHYALYSKDVTTSAITEDRFSYISKKIQRLVRLPLLIGAAYLGYKGIKPALVGDSTEGVGIGLYSLVSGIGLATSMYLKDTDPKLLDKEPAWKRVSNWLTEKAQSLVHRPVPVPVPTRYDVLPTAVDHYE